LPCCLLSSVIIGAITAIRARDNRAAFVDGNKRSGFVTALTFLRLNGFGFRPGPVEGLRMMEGLAEGAVPEAAFAAWLGRGMAPL